MIKLVVAAVAGDVNAFTNLIVFTAVVYTIGALTSVGYTQIMVRAARDCGHQTRPFLSYWNRCR